MWHIQGQLLFNIFFDDMGSGIEWILSSFMDGTELCGAVVILEERDCIPRDLGRLERRGCVSLVEFNKAKNKVCTWFVQFQAQTEGQRMEWEQPWGERLEVLVHEKLDMIWQFAPAAQKAKCAMGCTEKLGKHYSLDIIPAHGSGGKTKRLSRSIPTQITVWV